MADATGAVLTAAAASNPYLAIGGQFAQGLGQAMGSSGGPSNAAGRSEAVFDNSGWNVTFGAGNIDSTSEKTTSTGAGGMGNVNDYLPYILVAAGLLITWRMTRKKR